jgi:hypothetical protein
MSNNYFAKHDFEKKLFWSIFIGEPIVCQNNTYELTCFASFQFVPDDSVLDNLNTVAIFKIKWK